MSERDVPCMECLAKVARVDMDAHAAWHRGLVESIVRTVLQAIGRVLARWTAN